MNNSLEISYPAELFITFQKIFDLAADAFLQPDSKPSVAIREDWSSCCAYRGDGGNFSAMGLYLKKYLPPEVFEKLVEENNTTMLDLILAHYPSAYELFRPIVEQMGQRGYEELRNFQLDLHDRMRDDGDDGNENSTEWYPELQSVAARVAVYSLLARKWGLRFDSAKYLAPRENSAV